MHVDDCRGPDPQIFSEQQLAHRKRRKIWEAGKGGSKGSVKMWRGKVNWRGGMKTVRYGEGWRVDMERRERQSFRLEDSPICHFTQMFLFLHVDVKRATCVPLKECCPFWFYSFVTNFNRWLAKFKNIKRKTCLLYFPPSWTQNHLSWRRDS